MQKLRLRDTKEPKACQKDGREWGGKKDQELQGKGTWRQSCPREWRQEVVPGTGAWVLALEKSLCLPVSHLGARPK